MKHSCFVLPALVNSPRGHVTSSSPPSTGLSFQPKNVQDPEFSLSNIFSNDDDGRSSCTSKYSQIYNYKISCSDSSSRLWMGEADDEFWIRQRALLDDLSNRADKSLKQEQLEKFADRRSALISDTAFFTFFIFALTWAACANPFVAFSYVFGSAFGLAYAYGLGKYVETLGGSPEDTEASQGAGVGQARFAFLIMLFILVGKFRDQGLVEIPSILGFFTYQLASLSQGLREIND